MDGAGAYGWPFSSSLGLGRPRKDTTLEPVQIKEKKKVQKPNSDNKKKKNYHILSELENVSKLNEWTHTS